MLAVCMYDGVGVVIVYQCTSVDCGCCQEMVRLLLVVVGCCWLLLVVVVCQ